MSGTGEEWVILYKDHTIEDHESNCFTESVVDTENLVAHRAGQLKNEEDMEVMMCCSMDDFIAFIGSALHMPWPEK